MDKKYIVTFVLGILLLLAFWLGNGSIKSQTKTSENVSLIVSADKNNYIPGEIVQLKFKTVNNGQNPVRIMFGSVNRGFLEILVAASDGVYKKCYGPGWGLLDTRGSGVGTLEPNQSFTSQAAISWNPKPDFSHLNEDAAQRAAQGRIMTDYIFREAGVYFVKAELQTPSEIPGENPQVIESEPVQIVISEPVGDDLKIWNKVKDDSRFGYFMQANALPNIKPEEKEKLLGEIESIVREYQTGILADQMKQSLVKFRVDEAESKKFVEKIKIKKEKKQ